VVEQNIAEGKARTMFCGTQAASGGAAFTVCYAMRRRTQ